MTYYQGPNSREELKKLLNKKQSSITRQESNNAYSIYYESSQINSTFTRSPRSNCLILPQISKGPQSYFIQSKQFSDKAISFKGYAGRQSRKLDAIPGPGSYNLLINQKKSFQRKESFGKKYNYSQSQNIKPFREYSFLQVNQSGPSLLDIPQSTPKNIYFNKSKRFIDYEDELKNYSHEEFQKVKTTNESPAYSFKQESLKIESRYHRQLEYIQNHLPGPGQYLSDNKQKKSICFPKAKRFKN